MTDTREDHSASRATYFVFIFLTAAIMETALASWPVGDSADKGRCCSRIAIGFSSFFPSPL